MEHVKRIGKLGAFLRACGGGERGMTLIEIMVVVVIMALIATGVAVAVVPQLRKAQVKTTCVRIHDIMSAAELYMMDNVECPTMDELKAELKGDPEDSWGNEMKVECPSEDEVIVVSGGRDGNFGTDDDLNPESCRSIMKGKKGEEGP
jgi:general secretion pathway protein G